MKYISLFEKFESTQLSKVLRYISKADRSTFLSDIKKISIIEDIEMSKISDDMFTYTSYKEGIKIQSEVNKSQCTECQGEGKIKKPWGTEGNKGFHYRYLICKSCGGSGEIKSKYGNITDIKFWFNTDGKYLGKTCINGRYAPIDYKFDLFTEIKPLNHEELIKLPTGTKIKIYIGYTIVATIFKDPTNDRVYAVQNSRDGGSPGFSNLWNDYGKYCWRIDSTNNYRNAVLLEPKPGINQDPLSWNFGVELTSKMSVSNTDVKEIVKNAEFCLILNLSKFYSLKSSPRSIIAQRRQNSRPPKKTDNQIKSENIQKYMIQLSSRYKTSPEVGNISKIVPRLMGWSMSFYFILKDINLSTLSNIVDLYFSSFKRMEEIDKEEISDDHVINENESDIKHYLKDGYHRTSIYFQSLSESMKKLESESKNESLECINLLKELGKSINENILKKKIETLSDLEIIMFNISNIKSMMQSRRYSIRNFEGYLKRMDSDPESLISIMRQEENKYLVMNMNKDLKRVIEVVKKMQ